MNENISSNVDYQSEFAWHPRTVQHKFVNKLSLFRKLLEYTCTSASLFQVKAMFAKKYTTRSRSKEQLLQPQVKTLRRSYLKARF